MPLSRKVFLQTFGCQMNDFDSEIILGMLRERGYSACGKMEEADLILFNTCSVRQHAEDRVFGNVGSLKVLKRERPDLVIGIVGCMAQNYEEEIFKKLPHVDFISGPRNIYDIPELIERVSQEHTRLAAVDKSERPIVVERPIARQETLKAWVTVMEGCHHNCTFCIVPRVRGTAQSRPVEMVLEEIRQLDAQGYKEITLIGQIIDAYGRDLDPPTDLAALLSRVAPEVRGIERIRFTTSHPVYANEKLFDAIKNHPKICEHLHLPVQSGSDRILKHMRRGYTRSDYLRRIDALRSRIPHAAVTTDMIVGYPTETEGDFSETVSLMQEVGFDDAYVFKFSPRQQTDAFFYRDDVPKKIKEERNQILLKFQTEESRRKMESQVGKTVEVLVEGKSKKDKSEWKGRTRTNREVIFSSQSARVGQLAQVTVGRLFGKTLLGRTPS